MAGPNEQELTEQAAAPSAESAGDASTAGTTSEQNPKGFVPFFNEEYEFKLGSLGELGPAIRLSIAFGFMLLAAGLFYCATWWWVGIPPMGN